MEKDEWKVMYWYGVGCSFWIWLFPALRIAGSDGDSAALVAVKVIGMTALLSLGSWGAVGLAIGMILMKVALAP